MDEIQGQECEITIRENGPYVISGNFKLTDAEGNAFTLNRATIALCRCGQSDTKPFCDGTHKSCGFSGPSVARVYPEPEV